MKCRAIGVGQEIVDTIYFQTKQKAQDVSCAFFGEL